MARPLKFKTPSELESKVTEYFQYCEAGETVKQVNKWGQSIEYRREMPLTIWGMAFYLDCSSRTLREYAKREGFSPVLSRARMRIYGAWIRRGLTGAFNPNIVALLLAAHCPEYRRR